MHFLPLPLRQGDRTDKKQFWVFSEDEYFRISVDQNINDTLEKERLDKDIKPEWLLTRPLQAGKVFVRLTHLYHLCKLGIINNT